MEYFFFKGSLQSIRSQTELRTDVEKLGSLPRVDEVEVFINFIFH